MNCKLLTKQGKNRTILKHTFYSTDIHLGKGKMRKKGIASFYQKFALGLFIKALTKQDCKCNTAKKHLDISSAQQSFANNIHLHFCPCIKLSNEINSSGGISIICHKILELFTPLCQIQGISHPKKLC